MRACIVTKLSEWCRNWISLFSQDRDYKLELSNKLIFFPNFKDDSTGKPRVEKAQKASVVPL